MTLGEHIILLRSRLEWSQDDLAAQLGVSRQSVSKWETDASIPDLDKLLAMSEVFGLTLDELVKGPQPEQAAPQAPEVSEMPETTPPHPIQNVAADTSACSSARTSGVVLLCFGFAVMLALTLLGGFLEGLAFSIPFFVCALLCFVLRRHAGLWCAWTVVLFVIAFLRVGTGISWRGIFVWLRYPASYSNPLHPVIAAGMLLALLLMIGLTLRAYRDTDFPLTRRNKTVLIALWAAYLLVTLGASRIVRHLMLSLLSSWPSLLQDGLALALLLPALIFTAAACRTKKRA